MSQRGLFEQNVVAVIWDFDKTLSPHYMQRPLFEAYGVDEAAFWDEVNALPRYYAKAGIHLQADTCYLGHLLSYVQHGRFAKPPLTNARLRELGQRIEFFKGVPDVFERLTTAVDTPDFRAGDVRVEVEHYVVSTGLAELVRGSRISPFLKRVFASEFIEQLAAPGADLSQAPQEGPIQQIASFLDNTTKTRALFEINKGVGVAEGISVNDDIPEEDRRIPFRNMVYIADGPSDIPSFSVVKKHGGLALAVFDPASEAQYEQVESLFERGRVHFFGPADYRSGSTTSRWLQHKITQIAKRILQEREKGFRSRVKAGPSHLDEGDEA